MRISADFLVAAAVIVLAPLVGTWRPGTARTGRFSNRHTVMVVFFLNTVYWPGALPIGRSAALAGGPCSGTFQGRGREVRSQVALFAETAGEQTQVEEADFAVAVEVGVLVPVGTGG